MSADTGKPALRQIHVHHLSSRPSSLRPPRLTRDERDGALQPVRLVQLLLADGQLLSNQLLVAAVRVACIEWPARWRRGGRKLKLSGAGHAGCTWITQVPRMQVLICRQENASPGKTLALQCRVNPAMHCPRTLTRGPPATPTWVAPCLGVALGLIANLLVHGGHQGLQGCQAMEAMLGPWLAPAPHKPVSCHQSLVGLHTHRRTGVYE